VSYEAFLDQQFPDDEEVDLSVSDEAYLNFRRVADPGMLRVRFDLTPAKSSDTRSRRTGEYLVDQPLRSHTLSGAAFGSRFNAALDRLGLSAAKDGDELRRVMALFSCHDLHKTDEAQHRYHERPDGRKDADKDIPDEELRKYVDGLDLDDLNLGLDYNDYLASALATEKGSGPHKSANSNTFRRLRDWVRLMDAAAGLEDPAAVDQLASRASAITDAVRLEYHRLDDTKGITTNLLNTAIASHFADDPAVEPVVYFENGVIYAVDEDAHPEPLATDEEMSDTLIGELTDGFIDQVKASNPAATDPERVRGLLVIDGRIGKGYVSAEDLTYFLAGREAVFEAVEIYLTPKGNNGNWRIYNAYRNGVGAALAAGLIDEAPSSHQKIQAVGIYIATAFYEIYNRLNNDDPQQSMCDIARALDCLEAGEFLAEEYEADSFPVDSEELSSDRVDAIAGVFDVPIEEVPDELESLDLHSGGVKSFAQTLAATFVSDAGSRRPVETLLEEVSDRLDTYYRDWQPHWDNGRDANDWDSEWDVETKQREFEKELQGILVPATKHYIRSNLDIGGQWAPQEPSKSKLGEYSRSAQGRVCLLCNDILVGSNSMKDFPMSLGTAGISLSFSHNKPLSTVPKSNARGLACPVCKLEMILRNTISAVSGDKDNNYLFVAPDYFFSPVDIEIAKELHSRLQPTSGDLYALAAAIASTEEADRSAAADKIVDVLAAAADEEEYRRLALNYDNAFFDDGALGVFRIQAPRRQQSDEDVSAIAHWSLSAYFAIAFAWLSGSRVSLTDNPIPNLEPSEFNEMVRIEGAPGVIERFIGESISVSRLPARHDDEHWGEHRISYIDKPSIAEDSDDTETNNSKTEQATSETEPKTTTKRERVINTGLGAALYKYSALTYITTLVYNEGVQRQATLLSSIDRPFTGATALLKGNEQYGGNSPLLAGTLLDTLMHDTTANRLETLADAGFELARPDTTKRSNYEYERLFRVARDSLSDGMVSRTSRDELLDIVSGDVRKSAARNRTDDPNEGYLVEPADEFAQVFVDDVLFGICGGDFYELRQLENRLAAGYNAAMRRRMEEFFADFRDDTTADDDEATDESAADTTDTE